MWGEEDPFVIQRLEGISNKPILSIANYISLDADYVVAGSTDRSIRFYETQTMKEVMKTTMEKKNVSIVAVSGMSPDGDDPLIVTGGKDSVIQVWNSSDRTPQQVIKLPTTEVKALAVYQGSRTLIAIGTRDGKLLLWDLDDNRLRATFVGHRASIYCVCITVTTPDLEYLEDDMKYLCIASGGADRTVRNWDLSRGKRIKKFRHARSISSIAVTNRGIRPLLASAGVERIIKIWDLDSGILLRCLHGHLDQITTMTLWEGNQMFIISGSADHTIRIFDMISGECFCVLKGHRDSVLSLTIADWDQPKIVSSGDDLSIIQWDLDAIIEAFYDNSEEGEGARTALPPYLPPVEYVAPDELDKSRLSKEERKRIRKERKRAKRLRNLQSFSAASSKSPRRNNDNLDEDEFDEDDDLEALGSFVFDDDDDNDDNDLGDEEPAISIPDAIREAAAAVSEAMKEEGKVAPPELTQSSSKSALLRVGSNKVIPHGEDSGHINLEGSTSGGIMKGIWNRVFHPGHNKVGIDNSTVADTEISTPSVENQEDGKVSSDLPTPADSAEKNSENGVSEEKPTIEASSTSQTPSKPLVVGEDSSHNMIEYKSITKMKTTSFSQAVSDQMREHDRMKSKASEKLKNRLLMKQLKTDTTAVKADDAVASNDGTDGTDAASQAEFMRVKAEKLRQHKLTERRRKESMMVSKNRSGLALQKRLEDLKNKRKQQQEGNEGASKQEADDLFEMAEEGDDDDDDEDGNNSDNDR
jgi:WD40 repeat protein